MAIKKNPGKYPTPKYIVEWYNARGRYGAAVPQWWPTKEIMSNIITQLSQQKPISKIFESPNLPAQSTFFLWIATGRQIKAGEKKNVHPDMLRAFGAWENARAARLEFDIAEFEEIERKLISIPQKRTSKKVDAAGRHYTEPNPAALDVQAARTVLESRRWRLSRELPERFGDRSKVEHSGTVKVERPKDNMPEWMQPQLEDQAAKVAADQPPVEAPAPTPQAKPTPKTVH